MNISFLKTYLEKLKPYWGMFYFAGILLLTHYVWKYSFTEGLQMGGAPQVWLWQAIDCTQFFDTCVRGICTVLDGFMSQVLGMDGYQLFGPRFYLIEPARSVVSIVWSCTGLKQLFVFTMMLLCYPYAHKQKLWAIPTFGVVILLINLIRLTILICHIKTTPADFDAWHEASKYVFYAIMFGLWILWEEIVKKHAPRNWLRKYLC